LFEKKKILLEKTYIILKSINAVYKLQSTSAGKNVESFDIDFKISTKKLD